MSASSLGGGQQDVPEGRAEGCRLAWPGLRQLSLPLGSFHVMVVLPPHLPFIMFFFTASFLRDFFFYNLFCVNSRRVEEANET